jgi:LCP family protein required for cell wall assembly
VSVDAAASGPRAEWQTHDGFTAIYHQNVVTVYRFCLRRSATPHEAEELTALVFVECWRGRAKVERYDGPPAAWLLGIATNLLRTSWRARRRREAALVRLRHDGATLDDSSAELSAEASARILRTLQREMRSSESYVPAVVHRSTLRRVTLGALAMASVVTLLGVGYAIVQYRRIHRVDIHTNGPTPPVVSGEPDSTTTVATTPTAPVKAMTFLIVGSDSRACIDPKSPNAGAFMTGEDTGYNADTIMLARVDPSGPATLLSLPRDLWVTVPGSASQRTMINSLYEHRNPERLVRAIEENLTLHIDHYIDIDFCGFRDLVDSLGGVAVPFTYPAYDRQTGLNVDAGCHTFAGEEALAYVRSRYYQWFDGTTWQTDEYSDLGRISRQQDFVKRALAKAIDRGVTNPIVAKRLLDAAVAHLTIDRNLGLDDLVQLATTLKSTDPAAVRRFRLEGFFGQDGDIIVPDLESSTNKAVLAIMRGEASLAAPAPGSAEVATVDAVPNTIGVVPAATASCP